MFSKETYIRRRQELKRLVGEGVIILFGNNESPYNYPANAYAPMRQDSSFLYYFGQHRDGLVGVIDIDNDEEWLFGDDIDVEDIVWMGFTPSVADLAAEVGISKTAPMKSLNSQFENSTFPTAIPLRHEDTDYGPARHPSLEAEGGRLAETDQGGGEDACHKGAAGDRGHRTGLQCGLCHAYDGPDAHQARCDGKTRGRTGGRHCPQYGSGQQLRHDLLATWGDHARCTV